MKGSQYFTARNAVLVAVALACGVWLVAKVAVPMVANYRLQRSGTGPLNSPAAKRYGQRLAESLPAKGAVVLSDDPLRLRAVALALGSSAQRHVLLDSTRLPERAYLRELKERYGARLPEAPAEAGSNSYSAGALVQFLTKASAQSEVYYLHPSLGYFFERFYLEPHRAVYQMKPLPANVLTPPPLDTELTRRQEAYWQEFQATDFAALKQAGSSASGGKSATDDPNQAGQQWAAGCYSRALDDWGVRLLMSQKTDQAIEAFQRALELNPENPCAFVNLEWARAWQKTGRPLERFSNEAMAKLKPYAGNWDLLLGFNGPVDEPTFRYQLAQEQARGGLPLQAAQQLLRALAVNPKALHTALLLGSVYVQAGLPDQALGLIARIRSDAALAPKEPATQVDLIAVEAGATAAKGDFAKAESLLRAARAQYPQLDGPYAALARLFLSRAEQERAQGRQAEYLKDMTNGLSVFETQINVQTTNAPALINYASVCAQLDDTNRALAALSRALALEPGNELARLARAGIFLRTGRSQEADQDYAELLKRNPASYLAFYGRAETAWREQNWARASESYEGYLKYAPRDTAEYRFVQARLTELKQKVNK